MPRAHIDSRPRRVLLMNITRDLSLPNNSLRPSQSRLAEVGYRAIKHPGHSLLHPQDDVFNLLSRMRVGGRDKDVVSPDTIHRPLAGV